MSWIDTLIGAGVALAGVGVVSRGTSRDRQQRTADAREDRDYTNRRQVCLLLEGQRIRQVDELMQMLRQLKLGETVEFEHAYDDVEIETKAAVSLFLPEGVEDLADSVNQHRRVVRQTVAEALSQKNPMERLSKVLECDFAFDKFLAESRRLRAALREEARSR